LAWEAAADDIGGDAAEGPHIPVNGDIWPVLSEHPLAIGVDFAEGDGSHSGSFEPEAETADPAKEVEDIQLFLHLARSADNLGHAGSPHLAIRPHMRISAGWHAL
jgi:hypothetical protein